MAIRFILLLIAATLLALLGYWFYINPGYVILSWLGFEFKVSVSAVLLLLILFVLVLTILFKALSWLLGLPFRLTRNMRKSRKAKGMKETVLLASAIAAENPNDASKHMKRAKATQSQNPLFWWYAAQAYGLNDDHLEESKAYGQLLDTAPFLAFKGKIMAALKRDDRQSALDYLEKARDEDPQSPWVLRNLLTLYRSAKRYEDAEDVINRLEDFGYFAANQAKQQLAALYEAMADDGKLSEQAREEALRKAHYLNPALAHVTEAYAKLMFSQGHETNALKALEATWKAYPAQVIGDLFIELQKPQNAMGAYELAKKLVRGTTAHEESRLLVARYAINAKLWGEARKVLLKLEKELPSPRVYKLLANLEIKEHNNLKASHEWALKGCEA